MIRDGNYSFYDLNKDKEKFKEVLTKYYGEEHRDIVSERIDRIKYVPYYREDFVYYYSFAHLNNFRDEVAEEFKKLSHLDNLPKEFFDTEGTIADLCWSGVLYGKNIEIAPVPQSFIELVNLSRSAFAKLVGISTEEQDWQNKVLNYMSLYLEAEKTVMRNHPCDVFNDDIKFTDNKIVQLQAFLFQLSRREITCLEGDREVFNSSKFNYCDAESLASRCLLYGKDITEGGLIESFCSQELVDASKNINCMIDMYINRLKFFKLYTSTRGGFKYVTDEEIYDEVAIDDKNEFLTRLINEYQEITNEHPEWIVPNNVADGVKRMRLSFAESVMAGVKFCESLATTHFGAVHDIYREPYFVTYLAYDDNNITTPGNCVVFNEDEYDNNLYALSHNMCHEVAGHVCGHGNVKRGKNFLNKNKAFSYVGIHGIHKTLKGDEVIVSGHFDNFEGMMLIEEYIAERIGMEVHDLFREMYGRDVFVDKSDYVEERDDYDVALYRYYGFILEKFWETYRERIIESRISYQDGGIYYDNNGFPPQNALEKLYSSAEYNLMKVFNPTGVQSRGIFNYTLLHQLGLIVEKYLRSEAYDYIKKNDVCADDLTYKGIEEALGEDAPQEIIDSLHQFQDKASEIIDSMVTAENQIHTQAQKQEDRRKKSLKSLKSVRAFFTKKHENLQTQLTIDEDVHDIND